MRSRPPLEIINDTLLAGMKTVGDLFGGGEMQLPFVLQSAEVMKAAVAHLEPHMEKADAGGKGTIVLATVRGDVHDIGKNLVDIILSNNGYTVVNLGIKQPVAAILDAAVEHRAHAIGMSGLLVKSTVVMRDNLLEMKSRGIAHDFPVLLGGAALTRAFVEQDLGAVFDGQVRYARDAFEGLRLMDTVMAVKRGEAGAGLPEPRRRRTRPARAPVERESDDAPALRSDVASDLPVPTPPFWGDRVVKGVPLAEYAAMLDERATFMGQWGLRGSRGGSGPSYDELVEAEGRPRLRMWRERRLCLADFFRPRESGETDVVAFTVVTMGARISEVTADLFARNAYRDYLELHGLSVQLTEALAEYWHKRVREEFAVAGEDSLDLQDVFRQGYRGSRYSFGYPACPNLEDQVQVVGLLRPERIGVRLSEGFQLHPEQSTSAVIVHHPEAKYFNAT